MFWLTWKSSSFSRNSATSLASRLSLSFSLRTAASCRPRRPTRGAGSPTPGVPEGLPDCATGSDCSTPSGCSRPNADGLLSVFSSRPTASAKAPSFSSHDCLSLPSCACSPITSAASASRSLASACALLRSPPFSASASRSRCPRSASSLARDCPTADCFRSLSWASSSSARCRSARRSPSATASCDSLSLMACSSSCRRRSSAASPSSIALRALSAFCACSASTAFSKAASRRLSASTSGCFSCFLLGLADRERAWSWATFSFMRSTSASPLAADSSSLSPLTFATRSLTSRFCVSTITFRKAMFWLFPSRLESTLPNRSRHSSTCPCNSATSCCSTRLSCRAILSSASKSSALLKLRLSLPWAPGTASPTASSAGSTDCARDDSPNPVARPNSSMAIRWVISTTTAPSVLSWLGAPSRPSDAGIRWSLN